MLSRYFFYLEVWVTRSDPAFVFRPTPNRIREIEGLASAFATELLVGRTYACHSLWVSWQSHKFRATWQILLTGTLNLNSSLCVAIQLQFQTGDVKVVGSNPTRGINQLLTTALHWIKTFIISLASIISVWLKYSWKGCKSLYHCHINCSDSNFGSKYSLGIVFWLYDPGRHMT